MAKHICLAFESEAHYQACLQDTNRYRKFLNQMQHLHPELFPTDWPHGFTYHDSYFSTKQKLSIRRVKLKATKEIYSVRPSFVMPYMSARTQEVEKALYLLQFGVPLAALVYVFGRSEMFWHRAYLQFGRPSLLGTTVKDPEKLPAHLVADEKHTWIGGTKVYVPTTAAGGCFLGVSVVEKADTDSLQHGYGEFVAEARQLSPDYQPQSVTTDGFPATREAWRLLFPRIQLILCFLHAVLKIKDRCRGAVRKEVLDRVWNIYQAADKRQFSQRARRVREWIEASKFTAPVKEMVLKLCHRTSDYVMAYSFPSAARTTNGVDRLMNYQDRLLYAMRYFHHSQESARLSLRAMAMLWNFHPYSARLRRNDPARHSPFHDLNGFYYHQNWLENFLISSSLGGLKC